jgi:outer membrane protein assembly factor BamB
MKLLRGLLLYTCILTPTLGLAATPPVADALKAMENPVGLVVHVGASEGTFEAELTAGGKILVQNLARDDAGRDQVRATLLTRGVYPLASAMTWQDKSQLPYASNLINLLVVDRDELGAAAPPAGELMRVIAPFGALYEKTGGAWKVTRKPRPTTMDDWTHFDYGPDGATCSQDQAVKPIRQLQWITLAQPNPWSGNPAGYNPGGGVRIWGRYTVLDIEDRYAMKDPASKEDTWSLQCRDAFNGIPLWTIRRDRKVGTRRWSLVADQGMVFTYLKAGADLVALDIATGQVKHSFPGTASAADKGLLEETHCVRVVGDKIIVAATGKLKCFQTQTGKELWSYARPDLLLLAPSVDVPGGRVYALLAKPSDYRTFTGRWPVSTKVQMVLALELATGKMLWENPEMVSVTLQPAEAKAEVAQRGIGQLLPVGDKLIVWGSAAISGGERPFIATLDAKTGRTLHSDDTPFKRNYNVAAYNVLRQNGKVFFAGAFMNIWNYDPDSGKTSTVVGYSWNQRCTRFTATNNFLLFGQMGFYTSTDYSGEQITAARSGCAIGSFPANGMVYSTANACGCITQVRGFNAMTGDDPPKPMADAQRLLGAAPASKLPAEEKIPTGEIANDWPKQWRIENPQAAAVKAGDVDVVVDSHQQRVDGRRGTQVAWSFLADGRVSGVPLVQGDSVIFGDHTGWVYAVSAKMAP